jgi:hypothetical protein
MHIEAALRLHLTPVRLDIIKETNSNAAENAGKRNPQTLLVGL